MERGTRGEVKMSFWKVIIMIYVPLIVAVQSLAASHLRNLRTLKGVKWALFRSSLPKGLVKYNLSLNHNPNFAC